MPLFLQSIRQVFLVLGPRWRTRWIALVAFAALVTGLEALGAILIYSLMGLVAAPETGVELPLLGDVTSWFPGVDTDTVLLSVAAFVGVFFLVRAVAVIGQTYTQSRIVHNAGSELASHLTRGYLEMPYVFHTQHNSAELVRNAFDSVQTFSRQVLRPLVTVFAELFLVAGLVLVMLWAIPLATLLAAAVIGPVVWILMRVVQPRLKVFGRRAQEAKKGSLKALQQSLGGVRDIRLLTREDYFARAFATERQRLARTEYLHNTLSEVPRALIETTLVITIVALFGVAVVAGEGLEAMLSTLGLFAYAGFRLQPSIKTIVKGLNDIRYGHAVLEDLLSDRRRVDAALRARPSEAEPIEPFQRTIELRDVSFRYTDDGPPALTQVSMTIRKGETIGICGPTGGGKSTLVDLIAGLLEPTGGRIAVDGRELGANLAWWYDQLGVVSQNVFLIDDTLRRNIALGLDDQDVDEAKLQRAISRAQLTDVVEKLSDGLATVVGERGIRLSGGQRQRVAIARALYREPSVIILDEGTSALDRTTEAALVAAMDDLREGRTLLAVAHRVSTVQGADRILVVQGGRIAAEGTYEDLIHDNELFRALAK